MSNREEFEQLEDIKDILNDHKIFFNEKEDRYQAEIITGNDSVYYPSWEITYMNGAWYSWQAAKAQAVPEGFVLVKRVHPDAIVHNQGLGLFKECQIIYGWDGKSKDFKDALTKGFYHGVKLGAKAVLETAMIEAQEQSHD